jgi:probable rRNA maturation factor
MPVEIARLGAGRKLPSRSLRKVAEAILTVVGQSEAEVSLALIGNAEMKKLNAQYGRKDYATDVLSFPLEAKLPSANRLLGDVIISVEMAQQQAKERGRTMDEEMVTLLIHGIVHLLGHDHERSAKDARVMKRLENKVYRQLCEQGLIKV